MRLRCNTTVGELAASAMLSGELNISELQVLFRIVALGAKLGKRKGISVRNSDLHHEPRTAARAVRKLARLRYLKTRVARDRSRTLELL